MELLFYLVVLCLFWTATLRKDAVVASMLVVLSIAWPLLYRSPIARVTVDRNQVWIFLSYFLSVMFWGAMLRRRQVPKGDADRRSTAARIDWPFIVVTALVFGRPLIALFFGSPTVNREEWRGTLLGLLLFVAALRVPNAYARPFAWLGTISYSLYLLHPITFFSILVVASRVQGTAQGPLPVFILGSTLASIGLASASYVLLERPSNRLARRWLRHRSGTTTPRPISGSVSSEVPISRP